MAKNVKKQTVREFYRELTENPERSEQGLIAACNFLIYADQPLYRSMPFRITDRDSLPPLVLHYLEKLKGTMSRQAAFQGIKNFLHDALVLYGVFLLLPYAAEKKMSRGDTAAFASVSSMAELRVCAKKLARGLE